MSLVVLLALALGGGASEQVSEASDLDARIRASAAAAETYQGPLDGDWRLTWPGGARSWNLILADPPGGAGPTGVWRDASGATGPLDRIERRGDLLTLVFTTPGGRLEARLARSGRQAWSGWIGAGAKRRHVVLRRSS